MYEKESKIADLKSLVSSLNSKVIEFQNASHWADTKHETATSNRFNSNEKVEKDKDIEIDEGNVSYQKFKVSPVKGLEPKGTYESNYTIEEISQYINHDIDKYDSNHSSAIREIEDSSMFGLTPTPKPESKGMSRTDKAAVRPTQEEIKVQETQGEPDRDVFTHSRSHQSSPQHSERSQQSIDYAKEFGGNNSDNENLSLNKSPYNIRENNRSEDYGQDLDDNSQDHQNYPSERQDNNNEYNDNEIDQDDQNSPFNQRDQSEEDEQKDRSIDDHPEDNQSPNVSFNQDEQEEEDGDLLQSRSNPSMRKSYNSDVKK